MKISIIVALTKNNVIGSKNKLLWNIPEDLKRFKNLTTGHHILMGRKTFESIGRILPNRTNIILSKHEVIKIPNAFVFNNLSKAIKFAKDRGENELFIIGGGMIYKECLPLVDKIYITKINDQYEGDVYFPKINYKDWTQIFNEKHLDNNPSFEYSILEK